jgi:hypothetical protein
VTQQTEEKPQQQRHVTPLKRTKVTEVDWQRFAANHTYGEDWIPGAIDRLKNGDVAVTSDGIGVWIRKDRGEPALAGAYAYWPSRNENGIWLCECEDLADFGMCSHIVAARMYRAWLQWRQSSRGEA